jgi:tetratricopeptide (TPR) repeat protein
MIERLPEDVRQRPQALAVLAADLSGLGEAAAAGRAADALTAHAALTEADVLSVLPALPSGQGDDVAARMLDGLDRRGLASPRALQAMAAIHIRSGRFTEARQALERAAAAGGPSAALLIELARTAVKLKDHKGALGYLAHARSLEPANAMVHFLFGMVCVEENLGREAYESIKKAVELDPDNALVNYAMGAVATARHEPSESLPYFEKYVRLKPDDPRGHFALGAARFYSNQFDEARPELERAARAAETATGAHYFLGRIARQANDLTTARREIERVLQLNVGLADAWAELGLIQTRAGEYGPAEQSLTRALAIEPDHYAASVNLATLYARTKDPRREVQAIKVAALIEKREARAQEFLRIIETVPDVR